MCLCNILPTSAAGRWVLPFDIFAFPDSQYGMSQVVAEKAEKADGTSRAVKKSTESFGPAQATQ